MRKTKGPLSRRQFAGRLAGIGAGAAVPMGAPALLLGQSAAAPPPSDRIVMGAIGIGNRGSQDLKCLRDDPRVQMVANCDIREDRRESIKSMIDAARGNKDCKIYNDAQDLLSRPDIEAVLIATSDRWHSLMSIWAAEAGKDIYCEKPLSLTIAESYALAETVRRYGRVYQAGCQRRNVPNFEIAVGLARSGKLGKLQTVHANTLEPLSRLGHNWWPAEPEPDPLVFNWDKWLGPCPWRPYNARYPNGGRGQFWDFHGGGILEWGSHTVDLCQWAADADAIQAIEYQPQGNGVHARYASGVKLVMRVDGWLGLGTCHVRFEGTEGWVETADTGKMEMSENLRSEHRNITMRGTDPSLHIQDFLHCIRSRSQPRANAESSCNTHVTCHSAYIAWQLGRKLTWDPAKRSFVNDEAANRMRSRAYREPWRHEAIATALG
jgi:predicted dehydrogenase